MSKLITGSIVAVAGAVTALAVMVRKNQHSIEDLHRRISECEGIGDDEPSSTGMPLIDDDDDGFTQSREMFIHTLNDGSSKLMKHVREMNDTHDEEDDDEEDEDDTPSDLFTDSMAYRKSMVMKRMSETRDANKVVEPTFVDKLLDDMTKINDRIEYHTSTYEGTTNIENATVLPNVVESICSHVLAGLEKDVCDGIIDHIPTMMYSTPHMYVGLKGYCADKTHSETISGLTNGTGGINEDENISVVIRDENITKEKLDEEDTSPEVNSTES